MCESELQKNVTLPFQTRGEDACANLSRNQGPLSSTFSSPLLSGFNIAQKLAQYVRHRHGGTRKCHDKKASTCGITCVSETHTTRQPLSQINVCMISVYAHTARSLIIHIHAVQKTLSYPRPPSSKFHRDICIDMHAQLRSLTQINFFA